MARTSTPLLTPGGNAREIARAKNQKKQADMNKGKSNDSGLTLAQRRERDAAALRAKQEVRGDDSWPGCCCQKGGTEKLGILQGNTVHVNVRAVDAEFDESEPFEPASCGPMCQHAMVGRCDDRVCIWHLGRHCVG